MKKNVVLLASVMTLSAFSMLHAQDWKTLGNKIVDNNGSQVTFAVANNGTVYSVYSNAMNAKLLNAKKWDGSSWTTVGKDFSTGSASVISTATDNNGMLYVAYRDMKKGEKAVVMKLDGSNWVMVGTELSEGYVNGTALAFDKNNTPYVALADQKMGKLRVLKFVNNQWSEIASPFDATGDQVSLLSKDNSLYIYYADTKNGNKMSVKKFDDKSNSWTMVGKSYVSEKEAKYLSFAIDSKGDKYGLYQDAFFNGKIMVKKLDKDNNWVKVGEPLMNSPYNDNLSLALVNDVPFVAFHNKTNSDSKLDVKKFNGTAWVDAGNSSAGKGGGAFNSLIYANNALYVNFNEEDNGAVVKKLEVK